MHIYIYMYICICMHAQPPPPHDRPRHMYSVFLAGDSAKIGSCDIQPLRKRTATCTNLKPIHTIIYSHGHAYKRNIYVHVCMGCLEGLLLTSLAFQDSTYTRKAGRPHDIASSQPCAPVRLVLNLKQPIRLSLFPPTVEAFDLRTLPWVGHPPCVPRLLENDDMGSTCVLWYA